MRHNRPKLKALLLKNSRAEKLLRSKVSEELDENMAMGDPDQSWKQNLHRPMGLVQSQLLHFNHFNYHFWRLPVHNFLD